MNKLVATAAVLVLALCLTTTAQARPKYFENLKGIYPDNKEAAEAKCAICHGEKGAKKKVLSEFAKELSTALGAKDVKDDEAIKKALEAAGKKEQKKDETYDSILKAGKLPAPAP